MEVTGGGGGGAELTRLGIVVEGDGIAETRAALVSVGDAGEAAAKRTQTAFESSLAVQQRLTARAAADAIRLQQESANAAAAASTAAVGAQSTAAASNAQKSAVAYIASLKREFETQQAAIREGVARGLITTDEARKAGHDAAIAYNQAVLTSIEKHDAAGTFSGVTGRDTYTQVAGSLKSVEEQAAKTALNMNSVRAAATSMANAAVGAAPGVGQLAGVLGSFSLGALTTAGVMIGIAAVSYGWQKWTEEARKAKEEQDKLTASLAKWYETQRNGEAGARQLQVGAARSLLAQQSTQLAGIQDLIDNPRIAVKSGFDLDDLKKRVADLKALMQQERDQIAAGNQDITKTITEGFVQRQGAESANLAALISTNNATAAERKRALEILKQDQALLVAYAKPPADLNADQLASLLKARAELAQQAKALQDALYPKVQTSSQAAPRNEIIEALQRQADALRKVTIEGNAEAQKARDQTALLELQGAARDLLVNRIHAEEEAEKARAQFSGVVLTTRLADIAATKEQNDVAIKRKQLLDDLAASQKFLNSLTKEIADIGARNTAAAKQELLAGLNQTLGPVRDLISGFEHDMSRSIAAGLKSGFASFSDILKTAGNTFDDFASRAIAGKLSNALFTKIDAQGKITNTGVFSVADQKQLAQFAIAAAAVDGFANALNQLTGATQRTAAQLDAQIRSFLSLTKDVAAYRASVAGNSVASAIAQNATQAQSLRDETNAALPGKRLQGAREAQLAEITALEAQKNAQIASDFWAGITRDLNATRGAAGAYANELAAIDKAYAENLASAKALGAGTEQLTALYDAQKAAAAAAYAEAQTRTQEDLKVRGFAAAGVNDKAIEDERFRQAQRREIADLEAAHASEGLIAQTKELQNAEQRRRDADFAALNQRAQEDFRVRQLAAEGHSQEAAALRLQLEQQREYQDAVKAGLDAATLAALALAQTAESAAAAAKQAQDAQRALDDLQVRSLQAQGNTTGADQLRFQLQQQRELEDAIAAGRSQEYLDQLKAVQALEAKARADAASGAVASTAARQQPGATEAVSYAARNLSEITGNRMADYLASILIVVRQIADRVAGRAGIAASFALPATAPGAIPSYAQPVGFSGAGGAPTFDRLDTGSLARWTAPTTATPVAVPTGDRTINVNVLVRSEGGSRRGGRSIWSEEDLDDLTTQIKGKLVAAIAQDEALQRLADGSPLLTGR